MLNWSKQENARRITASLIRYEFVDATHKKQVFQRLLAMIVAEDLSIADLRAMTHSVSRNVTERTRKKSAAALLSKLKRVKPTRRMKAA